MSYQRKIVVRGRKGRRHVVYQSLGDDSLLSSGASWGLTPPTDPTTTTPTSSSSDSTSGMFGTRFDSGSSGSSGGFLTPPGSSKPSSSSSDSGFNWGAAGQIGGNLLSAFLGPKPQGPVVMNQGMSTTTKIALAGAGVVALALVLRRRD